MLEALQGEFGKAKSVSFVENGHGLIAVKLSHKNGGSAELTLFGAHLLSWRTPAGEELLFLSERSDLSGKKAIRGGIPLVFPQFGPGLLPSHGFARTSTWDVASTAVAPNGDVTIVLSLMSSPESMKKWPYEFLALYTVCLGDSLTTEFSVKNIGKTPFCFQHALHSYFAVSDINETEIGPLQHTIFLDNTKGRECFREARELVRIENETDRIYLQAPAQIDIVDRKAGYRLAINKQGSADAVVWNPWSEKSKTLSDLGPEDYRRFVCVETGNFGAPIALSPGQEHKSLQTIRRAPIH